MEISFYTTKTPSLYTLERQDNNKPTLLTTKSMPNLCEHESGLVPSEEKPLLRGVALAPNTQLFSNNKDFHIAMQVQDEQLRLQQAKSPLPDQLPPLPTSPTPISISRSASPLPSLSASSSSTSLLTFAPRVPVPHEFHRTASSISSLPLFPLPSLPSRPPVHNRIRALTPRGLSPPRGRKTPVLINAPNVTWPQQQHPPLHAISTLSSLTSSIATSSSPSFSSSVPHPSASPSPPPTVPSIYERHIRHAPTRLSTVTEASNPGLLAEADTGSMFSGFSGAGEGIRGGREEERAVGKQTNRKDLDSNANVGPVRKRWWGSFKVEDVCLGVRAGAWQRNDVVGLRVVFLREEREEEEEEKREKELEKKTKFARLGKEVCRKIMMTGGCFGGK